EDPTTVRVQILGEGLASDVWYEASVRGYGELGPAFAPLAAARFSPGQDGKLDWSVRVNVADTDIGDKQPLKIGRLLVSVSRGTLDREAIKKYCVDVRFTCLSVRLPTTLDSGVVTTGTTSTT